MNHYQQGGQPPPSLPYHPSRRQSDYHYPPRPAGTPPQPQPPYPAYHHPQYHNPAVAPYPQQWYPPYQHYPHPPPQHFQPRSPLVVSSYPHAQAVPQGPRAPVYTPTQTPKPIPTPQPEQSTPSTTSYPVASPDTPSTSLNASTPPASFVPPVPPPPPPAPAVRIPFYPELPWYSSSTPFPPRAIRTRRKRESRQSQSQALELPARQPLPDADVAESSDTPSADVTTQVEQVPPTASASLSETPTPPTTTPVTGTSAKLPPQSGRTHARNPTLPVIPIVPIIPKTASARPVPVPASTTEPRGETVKAEDAAIGIQTTPPPSEGPLSTVSSPTKAPPKSWAELVKSNAPRATPSPVAPGLSAANGVMTPKSATLSDVLRLYNVEHTGKVSFLEPRGLINTGNMCYMNSILQILVFCVPFYEFLDQIGKRAAHNFKSDTPLIEAMIMFMREFNIIDSAVSIEQLRLRLKDGELEQYGEAFIPEYVYDVIRRLPRFSTMRRGHQQDAEEFLGFLLEGLHDECVQVMRSLGQSQDQPYFTPTDSPQSEQASVGPTSPSGDSGWLEVGPKQKPSITRSSGAIATDSPITKIFGGNLRSELRVQGLKNSVTLEPYQPLQLDIGAPDVFNITDALKGLTRSETLHGDFNSPRGPGVKATKQVFIESLPPVLILHLKRFQYDNAGGTQKIWKKIGYPLELEIPKEVFPPSKRGALALKPGGLPKYRLIGVVYHHGKNASGGHYTVDVRRQEGREWIRLDDTSIRRVRSADVAGEGAEEDHKVLAAALELHHRREHSAATSTGIFPAGFGDDADAAPARTPDDGWSQVNGGLASPGGAAPAPAKKWSSVANGGGSGGAETPSTAGVKTPKDRYSARDNKVAYILFYQQIRA